MSNDSMSYDRNINIERKNYQMDGHLYGHLNKFLDALLSHKFKINVKFKENISVLVDLFPFIISLH